MDQDMVENGKNGHFSDSAEGSLTTSVLIICVIAASAGLMFGYDIGVSGKLFSLSQPCKCSCMHTNTRIYMVYATIATSIYIYIDTRLSSLFQSSDRQLKILVCFFDLTVPICL